MTNHLVVSVAALACTPHAVIYGLAATVASKETKYSPTLDLPIDIRQPGRLIEPESLLWVLDMEDRSLTYPYKRAPLETAIEDLSHFIAAYEPKFLWAESADRDFGILETAYQQLEKSIPWRRIQLMSVGTFCSSVRSEPTDPYRPCGALRTVKYAAETLRKYLIEGEGKLRDAYRRECAMRERCGYTQAQADDLIASLRAPIPKQGRRVKS
jgi:hypothetical protein